MKKILIIDGNSLIHRAFHALPSLRTSKGIYTNAVYGFLNMLFRVLNEQEPDFIAVAFDKKGPTFRHIEYEAYKATRPITPPELVGQFDLVKEILKALNIKYIEAEGFEADDILGTLSKTAEESGLFSLILTGDKDALQLVSSKTNVMLTKKGISEMEIYDPEKMQDKYGIPPTAIPDMKSLMGDPSDNIPGVPGIGKKTAIKLLKDFGSVEQLLSNIDKLKGRQKQNLEKCNEQILESKYLATIVRNIKLDYDLEDLKRQKPNSEELLKLFRELEFFSLIDKLEPAPSQELITIQEHVIDNVDDLDPLLKKAKNCGFITVMLDTVVSNDIKSLVISTEDGVYSIPWELIQLDDGLKNQLSNIFLDSSIEKITHDGKFLKNTLRRVGVDFCCQFDTMLAAYLLNSSKPQYDLETIVFEYLGKEIKSADIYQRAFILKSLKDILAEKLHDDEMDDLFYKVELPLSFVLADMEFSGIKVNLEKLRKLSDDFGCQIKKLTNEIYELAGTEFNINSPKQLGEILFEKLSLPIIRKNKTGYSTSADVLEKLKSSHPIIEKILEYRFVMKMKSTYVDGLLSLVDKHTERIYTNYNQTVTNTGRISSTEPNLQNIPVKTDIGKSIRGVFIAENHEHLLLSGDYSQIELRVLAHISGDERLIEAFIEGEDIHTITASEVFGVPKAEVSPLLRERAKAVNFGIVYGISDYGLAQGLGISNKEASDYIEAYFQRYPGVKNYVKEIIKVAKSQGYVTTILNRRRYIPDINNRNYRLRSFAERVAMNTPIQGSAADIIKVAMVRIYEELKKYNLKTKLLLQIHDELIFDVPKQELEQVKQIVKQNMENAIPLKVPLVVDFKQGYTWEQL